MNYYRITHERTERSSEFVIWRNDGKMLAAYGYGGTQHNVLAFDGITVTALWLLCVAIFLAEVAAGSLNGPVSVPRALAICFGLLGGIGGLFGMIAVWVGVIDEARRRTDDGAWRAAVAEVERLKLMDAMCEEANND